MDMPSLQMIRSESEMVPELRPVMPVDLFKAAIKGDSKYIDELIQRLGVQPEERREIRLNIEDYHSAPDEINIENQTVQSELQTATRFGDTILHLLITEEHNELALKVFQRDNSLLKARNNMLETPLYCAAKVGNIEVIERLIQSNRAVVKDALAEKNKTGDTALLVAAKHGHGDIVLVLMSLDSTVPYKVNDKKKTPLDMAIIEGFTEIVKIMLVVDPTLACTPFSNGMFPVHEAARMGNLKLVMHFMENYSVDVKLRDPYGRNFFHIAAEENKEEFFNISEMEKKYFEEMEGRADRLTLEQWRDMIKKMISAKNYEGNTPFHIAAMEGNRKIMRDIWENYKDDKDEETENDKDAGDTQARKKKSLFKLKNKQGYTPLELSAEQVVKTNKDITNRMIKEYLDTAKRYEFSKKWFNDFMEPPLENKWERTQVIGLGSVLITTVAFAATFTMPGGYNQDYGTPVLGRKYMFRAFILANALAFIQGFLSLMVLLLETLGGVSRNAISSATMLFLVAAGSMVVAFGLGMYVTLASIWSPIAILLLVITLVLGTPLVIPVVKLLKSKLGPTMNSNKVVGIFCLLVFYVVSFLLIFCLAFV